MYITIVVFVDLIIAVLITIFITSDRVVIVIVSNCHCYYYPGHRYPDDYYLSFALSVVSVLSLLSSFSVLSLLSLLSVLSVFLVLPLL